MFFGNTNMVVNNFVRFLSQPAVNSLNKDEWMNLFDFVTTDVDLEQWDTNGSAPVVLDEFVAFLKTNQR